MGIYLILFRSLLASLAWDRVRRGSGSDDSESLRSGPEPSSSEPDSWAFLSAASSRSRRRRAAASWRARCACVDEPGAPRTEDGVDVPLLLPLLFVLAAVGGLVVLLLSRRR